MSLFLQYIADALTFYSWEGEVGGDDIMREVFEIGKAAADASDLVYYSAEIPLDDVFADVLPLIGNDKTRLNFYPQMTLVDDSADVQWMTQVDKGEDSIIFYHGTEEGEWTLRTIVKDGDAAPSEILGTLTFTVTVGASGVTVGDISFANN